MAVQISRRIYPEISKEEALRSGEEAPWRGVSSACAPEGVLDGGGAHHARSRSHADQRAAEAGGLERGWVDQRQKRDSRGEAFPKTGAQLCRPTPLGTRVLRGHGGKEYGNDPQVHPRTGVGGSQAGADGNARTVKRVTIKSQANAQ